MDDERLDSVELSSARLCLRRPTPDDIDTIHRITSDPDACAHNPADRLASRADAEDLYRRWDQHWRRHGLGYWVIRFRATAETRPGLGFCGLKVMQLADRAVLNLFYRLDPGAWGNGVATESATAVVGWATERLPGNPIVARVRPANVASARVAGRAGLRRAEHLDTQGEAGLDWIFTKNWRPGTAGS